MKFDDQGLATGFFQNQAEPPLKISTMDGTSSCMYPRGSSVGKYPISNDFVEEDRLVKQGELLQSLLIRVVLPSVFVAVAATLRIWPLHWLEPNLPWVTFFPAVIAAAVLGGLWAGLVATGSACVTVLFLWQLFAAEPFIRTNAQWIGMLVFIATGGMMSVVCENLRSAQARVQVYQTLVNSLDEGFCVVEMLYDVRNQPIDYRFVECNPAFEKQTGLREAKGKTIRQMVPGHESHWFEIYGNVARTGEEIRFENPAAGMDRHYDVFAFRIGGDGSNRVGILFKDVTKRKQQEKELIDAALYDKLTGLPNRAMFRGHFSKALARAHRSRQNLALLFLDLDGFKQVNDTFGHEAGDNLLRSVAQRLLSCVRAGDLVCRLGGDEFTVILENCGPEHLPVVAEKFMDILELPIDVDGKTTQISASIGMVTYPSSGDDEDTLLRRADATMYAVKKDRKKGFKVWDSSMAGIGQ
jgi:diguanylate cyclase (GGDEF)-like protein/PAS domain S-box-containing protein